MKEAKAAEGRKGNKNSSGTHTQISIRVKTELLLKIEELAERENRCRNNMIECLLAKAAKEKK